MRSRRRQYQALELLERYELLACELQHRTKNLLSVIISIASAILNGAGNGRDAFIARLHAMAKPQDLLMADDGRGATLADLAQSILVSFGDRVSLDGPPVHLKPSVAQGLALIMHQLATNAAKYGSLTTDGGRVTVQWSPQVDANDTELYFRWQERGGPPANPPVEKGFESVLLEHAVANTDTPPTFDYAAEGFTYELTASLAGARIERQ